MSALPVPPPAAPADRYRRLPERVLVAIRDQQGASECLIGWVQLGVVLLFGVLYAVSPKTFPADAPVVPVPWVLALYCVFTLVRLVLAYRGAVPDWLLYASTVLDMALLLGLIWSFHVQYMQPPSFYLKAPTLLYVFIFIALRALRFEARFVIVAGVVAALGWTALAAYAIYAAGPEMVTRDYVHYMTTNSILIGAELDKIISILMVTAIIAVAITRARRLLVRAVAEGAAAEDLSRFFAPEIARRITTSAEAVRAGEGQAREVAILICDIRGFTAYANRVPPNVLIGALTDYQRLIVPIVRRHGGSIDKFMGDGILATFGATAASETYAADALRAVEDVMTATAAWTGRRAAAGEEPLRVGAAVATGRIIFGAVGDETRLEYTVIGEAVNRAAKLEKHTKAERARALVDRATYERAIAQGFAPRSPVEMRPARAVEGLAEPLDVVVLAA